MPSSPTTLAELVEALDETAYEKRRLAAQSAYTIAAIELKSEVDLMERAAKVLRAVDGDCAVVEGTWYSPDETTGAAVKAFVTRVRVSITRALGGSDAERATRSEVGGTARFGADEDGPEIRDDLPPAGKASRL